MWHYTPKQMADLLLRQSQDVCEHLLGRSKKSSHHELSYGDISGAEGNSLKVNIKNGKWCDFASSEPGGDLLELWRQVRQLSCADAMREAATFLGVTLEDGTTHPARQRSFTRPSNREVLRRTTKDTPGFAYLKSRGLTEETLKTYHICELAPKDKFASLRDNPGTIAFPYLIMEHGKPIRINTKYLAIARKDGRKTTCLDEGAQAILFGWTAYQELVDSLSPSHPLRRCVAITEGEIDAMTMYQYGIPALSMPTGANGIDNWLPHEFDNLMAFDWIYLVLDTDQAGREGVDKLIERLGEERIKNVVLPHKDVNECLMQGMTAEQMQQLLLSTKPVMPKSLVLQEDIFDRIYKKFHPELDKNPGFSVPWKALQPYIRFAPGELTMWAGYTGHGKTTILNHVMCNALYDDEDLGIFIASFEMEPETIMHTMYRQLAGMEFPADGYLHKIKDTLTERVVLTEKEGLSHYCDELLKKMEYSYKRFGVTHFVVDSFGMITRKQSSRLGQYQQQDANIQDLMDFVMKYKIHLHLVAHNRKPEISKYRPTIDAHEVYNVSGSSNIVNWAHNVLLIERNDYKYNMLERRRMEPEKFEDDAELLQDYNDAKESPDAFLSVLKSRKFGQRKKLGLWYYPDCSQFADKPTGRQRYVQFAGDTSVHGANVIELDSVRRPAFDDDDEVI